MSAPVFLFGARRSGTTLLRLMINSHAKMGNPGEVDFLFDCLVRDASHPTGWRYDRAQLEASRIFRAHELDIDRGLEGLDLLADMIAQFEARAGGVLIMNVHRHADRILEVLPEARFIHLLRDPRDVARSSIGMGWAGISYYGIDHWIKTEQGWGVVADKLAPDQVLRIHFETLMGQIEPELKRLCDFLGAEFSPEMLDYHLNTTYGPPDPKIAEQWRRKASPHEIALMEGKCGPLIEARGYALNGDPASPGPTERVRLYLQNRLGRFQRTLGKIGLPLFVMEKLSRWLRLEKLHKQVRRRIDDKMIELLK